MTATTHAISHPPRVLITGFVYWLLFLLALEPGNIINAGNHLMPAQEILRILGASLLGACSAPLALAIITRYPAEGAAAGWNATMQIAGCIGIAAGLIALSCMLADWFLPTEHRPFFIALVEEMEGNGPLVAFCTGGFMALAHTPVFRRIVAEDTGALMSPAPNYLASFAVKARGREFHVALDRIDWIESQGNYLALHCGSDTHLLRMGLASLEGKLDPCRFARVHRRIIVALDRVSDIAPLGAGDAALRLSNGTELRLSRTYRSAFMAARAASAAKAPALGSLEVAPFQSYNS